MKKIVFSILSLIFVCFSITFVGCEKFEYKINFNVDGEIYHIESNKGNVYVELPDEPTKDNYIFNGWFFDEGTWKNEFTATSLLYQPITEDITVYAYWKPDSYSISYTLNGGLNNELNPDEYFITEEITLYEPTRPGYTFVGWFTTSAFDEDTKVTKIEVGSEGQINLYAKWELATYTITYHLDGGINSPDNIETYNVSMLSKSLYNPTKDGFIFEGWYVDSSYTTRVYVIDTSSKRNLNFYAKWRAS